jgi:hypothetical protein
VGACAEFTAANGSTVCVCGALESAHVQQDKSAVAVERDENGRLRKGSPNPGGQPKWVKGVRDALKALHPAARDRLERIIREGEDKDANVAIRIVYDFSLPKPKQTMKVEGGGKDPLSDLTAEALVAFIKNGGGK